ncbi:TPA: type II toxin-antitoxin system RelE/ParE family toxin [Stenotrophomonas maltophilia]|nr:type II toxin-antitoxin system RelE/ParE family toxin [Stenotrophomonas maltophilia]HDS1025210.1 type II toxin-antitoxin system RelE/ParE family toxin [Stenotrophomonas maltophilia]HDS1030115.1 type II toxin-antitoxin system RelE/ParE family toxin [Stenotrophomonas maltophilia]HDS1035090.1 type II toxin-antitoxin system RelE/ParE family toxin [Stenotrophomonas maltophilia]
MIMPRVFCTRSFNRSMRRSALTEGALCRAVDEMRRGLIDANLGGGVFKKRVALPGRGKRGSVRTLVATQRGSHWFFLFGYEKNQRATISNSERDLLLGLATDLFGMSGTQIASALVSGELYEICHGQDP